MTYVIGIDGGGTRTTVAVADIAGREVLRRAGPAGLVDPRAPVATVGVLVSIVRQAVREAGFEGAAAAFCAGLAGVGDPAARQVVQQALSDSGVAARVLVVCDGEIALDGCFGGGPGILLIAGTGSIAHGRGEDGRTDRSGGWGMILGDEGSGYAIGRAAMTAALRAVDGRGAPTGLLADLLVRVGIDDPRGLPSWAGRASKAEIAALVPDVMRLADAGDGPAIDVIREAAREQALHAGALVDRLGPWSAPPSIVLFGGVYRTPRFRDLVAAELGNVLSDGFSIQEPAGDAVTGAVHMAVGLVGAGLMPVP